MYNGSYCRLNNTSEQNPPVTLKIKYKHMIFDIYVIGMFFEIDNCKQTIYTFYV